MESTPIKSYAIGSTLDTPIDFAFSPRLTSLFPSNSIACFNPSILLKY